MKKSKRLFIIVIIETVLILGLGGFLYIEWYKPYMKEKNFKNSIKSISTENVNTIISDLKNSNELNVSIVNNALLNDSNWVNYSDNNVIVFKDDYFVWYLDSDLTSDNAMIGKFSYYEGSDAFNLIESSMNVEMDKTDNDSVLILNIVSRKKDGEETLDSEQMKYLVGYHQNQVMSLIDILSLEEYSFVEVVSE